MREAHGEEVVTLESENEGKGHGHWGRNDGTDKQINGSVVTRRHKATMKLTKSPPARGHWLIKMTWGQGSG